MGSHQIPSLYLAWAKYSIRSTRVQLGVQSDLCLIYEWTAGAYKEEHGDPAASCRGLRWLRCGQSQVGIVSPVGVLSMGF